MAKALIKIVYRQILDSSAQDNFAKNILGISYDEFLLKSQTYNKEGRFKTLTEMKSNDGRANSLHYKCGFAIGGFIEKLNKQIPGITDSLGQPVAFDIFKFEVIESDITHKPAHKVAIHYITGTLTYYDMMGDFMILSKGDNLSETSGEAVETFSLKLRDGLSVFSYREMPLQKQNIIYDN